MQNLILVNVGEKKKLKDLFGVSYPTVRKALRGEANTPLLLKIREAAIKRGGVEVENPKKKSNK